MGYILTSLNVNIWYFSNLQMVPKVKCEKNNIDFLLIWGIISQDKNLSRPQSQSYSTLPTGKCQVFKHSQPASKFGAHQIVISFLCYARLNHGCWSLMPALLCASVCSSFCLSKTILRNLLYFTADALAKIKYTADWNQTDIYSSFCLLFLNIL